ncbi:MAG: 2,3-bisphosphoglycerate-independent phosphoglycerate mutase [Candidatus Pacebacteria bacterium]|nr:2,3-bisphosphoglycerate-independent phosphoglycerate mutase [Candidatus Paceibacterota bacterium]
MNKVILVILDGWGISEQIAGNAIKNARTPNMDILMSYYPHTALQASGISVGLPWGTMGNSEVGHLTIGSGKVVYQNLPRVTISIQDESFFSKDALLQSIEHAQKNNSCIHLIGLLSTGAVHSHINHLYALLKLLKMKKIPADRVLIHVFTDGRDVNPHSGIDYVAELEKNIQEEGFPGRIASVMGRYYAMDRNENWDRTEKAYDCMIGKQGEKAKTAHAAILKSYDKEKSDEFIEPVLIKDKQGKTGAIQSGDSVIFYNIREDRARQITKAFALDLFNHFKRGEKIKDLNFTTMMEYEKDLPVNVVFPPEEVKEPLGKLLSEAGVKQLRIAETEKYAHVTYFFNGGGEKPFTNEFRILVPSPSVESYDQTPEMSAAKICHNVIKAIEEDEYGFILVNFANPDMIGHTGNIKAAIKAVEFVDKCVGEIYEEVLKKDMTMLVTADHGNAEEMINPQSGEILTEHTVNPVPFILVDPSRKFSVPQKLGQNKEVSGILSDIAPTVLEILQIEEPQEMTGTSLLEGM